MSPGRRGPAAGAVVWDFDGTLADTRRRNLTVTRRILEQVTGEPPYGVDALSSAEAYESANRRCANWRELYREVFGLDEEATDRAGRLWTRYQLDDPTPTPLFDGVEDAVRRLSPLPQAVVSLNSRANITEILGDRNLVSHFDPIVGYEEAGLRRQKPHPDALLLALEEMPATGEGRIVYVGDHETDVRCVRAAKRALRDRGLDVSVVSVAACFVEGVEPEGWAATPDHVARSPGEVVDIVGAPEGAE